MGGNPPVLLRHARHVQNGNSFPLKMGGHSNKRTDRKHPATTDARNENAVTVLDGVYTRFGNSAIGFVWRHSCRCTRLEHTMLNGNKTGAETLRAGVILVARGLIDRALTPEFRVHGNDRRAVRF